MKHAQGIIKTGGQRPSICLHKEISSNDKATSSSDKTTPAQNTTLKEIKNLLEEEVMPLVKKKTERRVSPQERNFSQSTKPDHQTLQQQPNQLRHK